MIRRANQKDFAALCTLETAAFGDNENFCRLIFDRLAGMDNVWVNEEESGIDAMALAVPVELHGRRGAYLYALTTAQAVRGQGRMASLLAYLKEEGERQGWDFLCLVPASEDLFHYYEKNGFTTAFWRSEYRLEIRRNLLAGAEFDDITIHSIAQLRDKFCRRPALTLESSRFAAVLTDYYSAGGYSVRTPEGYGFFRVLEGTLHFDEFFAADENAAMLMLQACREKTGCAQAVILAADCGLDYFGSGKRIAYGMLQPLGGSKLPQDAYLGMMLEF